MSAIIVCADKQSVTESLLYYGMATANDDGGAE